MKRIKIFDTTLRDGEQSPGCSMNLSEKLDMARQLDALGVDVIEAGFAIASPEDFRSVEAISQTITLPTGERVHRHPDSVIIVTTNSDYAGCRDVNQSIISRMDLIYDIEAPDLATMVKRVMNVTGCTDEQETTKMAMVVRDIAERCRQTMITDGSCGMRELKAWVLSTMITKDPYESALSTVISSASADPENRADLITTCLEKQYMR